MRSFLKHLGHLALAIFLSILGGIILFLFASIVQTARATDYSQAFDSAKSAALVQTGIQSDIDKLGRYGENKGKELICKVIPQQAFEVLSFGGFVAYKKRLFIPPFANPIFSHTKQSFTFEPSSAAIQITIEF